MMRTTRGFTIAETMVVALILGMLLTAVVGAIPPLFSAPDRAQAKNDSLAPAAAGMYLLQRDLRESDGEGTFACVGQPPSCGDGALDASDSAIVIMTARPSSQLDAQFQIATRSGAPSWQGFIVYRQAAPGGAVYRTFVADAAIEPIMTSAAPDRLLLRDLATAAAASNDADRSSAIALRGISMFAASVDVTAGVTSLHIVSTGTAGERTNTTTFDDDIFARN